MSKPQSIDDFLKRLITAPKSRQAAAVEAAAAALAGQQANRLLYGASEAARLLSVSRPTLWRMTKTGEITPVKLRGATRYRRADLERIAGVSQ